MQVFRLLVKLLAMIAVTTFPSKRFESSWGGRSVNGLSPSPSFGAFRSFSFPGLPPVVALNTRAIVRLVVAQLQASNGVIKRVPVQWALSGVMCINWHTH